MVVNSAFRDAQAERQVGEALTVSQAATGDHFVSARKRVIFVLRTSTRSGVLPEPQFPEQVRRDRRLMATNVYRSTGKG